MVSLYSFVDQMADAVLSVVRPQRSSKHSRSYSSSNSPSNHYYDEYDESLAYRRRRVKEVRSNAVCVADDPNYNRGHNRDRTQPKQADYIYPDTNTNKKGNNDPNTVEVEEYDTEPERYVRGAQHARNVHWGNIEEIPPGASNPSAPVLNQFHQRRQNGKKSYIYGAGSPTSSPTGSPSPSPSGNGNRSRPVSPTSSVDSSGASDERYPPGMYRRSFSRSPRSRSRSRSASLPGGYPRLPLHRTHIPRKGIIKPPTQKDDEMLIRNLWTMVALAEQRMDYTYEFLSGVLLIGDDILDTILKAGELSMFEEASRHARRMEERQRAREEEAFRPTKIPVPLKQYSSRSKWEVPKHARSEKRSLPVSAKSSPVGSGMDILEEAEEER